MSRKKPKDICDKILVRSVAIKMACLMQKDKVEADYSPTWKNKKYFKSARRYLKLVQKVNLSIDSMIMMIDQMIIAELANRLSEIDKSLNSRKRLKLASKIYNSLRPQGFGPKI